MTVCARVGLLFSFATVVLVTRWHFFVENLGHVHTKLAKIEKATLFLKIDLLSTLKQCLGSPKTDVFLKPRPGVLKALFTSR